MLGIRAVLVVGLFALGITGGCGPTPPKILELPGVTPAQRLRLTPKITSVVEHATHVEIAWEIDRQQPDIIRGYNIYVGVDSGLVLKATGDPALEQALHGGTHYPGDTDGDIRRESITIEDLTSGQVYFIHVRTVFPDGSESPASNQVAAEPRPRGTFALVPRFETGHDGFCFSKDASSESTSAENDLYMFMVEGTFFLASPDRLDRSLRETRFLDLGVSGSLDDHPVMPPGRNESDRIEVVSGRSIGLALSDGRVAKVRPLALSPSTDPPRITLEYIYQPRRGDPRF